MTDQKKKSKRWQYVVGGLIVLSIIGNLMGGPKDVGDACRCADSLTMAEAYNSTSGKNYWGCKNKYRSAINAANICRDNK